MPRVRALCAVFTASFSLAAAAAQTPSVSNSVDFYHGFVGTWEGTNQYTYQGRAINEAVRITIKESRKHDSLKCDYRYGTKGVSKTAHRVLTLTLEPAKGVVTRKWSDSLPESYDSSDLAQFAKTGVGRFIAVNDDRRTETELLYRFTVDLAADTFSYDWEKSEDGKTYVLQDRVNLHRSPDATH